jgi:hypothetical protein
VSISWPVIIMGWPAVVVALVLVGLGLATRRWLLALVGCLVALPFLWYLLQSPRFHYWAPMLVLLNFVSVAAIARGRRLLAAAVLAPFLVTVMWLAYAVLTQ